MRPAGLEQRGQQQVLGRRGRVPASRASFDAASMQPLGVRGVGQLLARRAPGRPPPPPASSRCAHRGRRRGPSRRSTGSRRCRRAASSASTMCSAPMASCSRRTASARALVQRALRAGAQRVRVHAGRGAVLASERLGFVDQHDGDAVLDRIDEAAGVADEGLGRRRGTRGHPCTWGRPGSRAARGPGVMRAPRRCSGKSEAGSSAAGALAPVRQHLDPAVEVDRRADQLLEPAPRVGADRLDGARRRAPITIPFWDSRSTNSVTRMYTGRSASRNSSTSAVKA